MNNQFIEIRGCSSEEELLNVIEVCDAAFPKTTKEYFERHLLEDKTLGLSDTRVLLKEGKIVSSVQLFPRIISTSSGALRFGGIGNVATLPSERRNGYAGLLLNDALDYLKTQGIPLSILTTHINSYYEKFGFETVRRTIARIESITGKAFNDIRKFEKEKDLRDVANLYNEFNINKTGGLVRDEKYWRSQIDFSGEDKDLFLVYEQDGELKGFVRGKRKENYIELLEYAFKGAHKTALTKLIESMAYITGLNELELFLTKKEEGYLDPGFSYKLKDENDLMICFLDSKINDDIKNELISSRNLNFWQSDFF